MGLANRQSNRIAIAALNIKTSDTVLELGFGPGRAVKVMARLAANGCVLGIDHSSRMLARAYRHNRRAIRVGHVQLVRGRFNALPWPTDLIDKILAVQTIYFAAEADLQEAKRVLRPEGRIAILATDRSAMERWNFCQSSTHRVFNLDDLLAFIVRGGFAAEEIRISRVTLQFGVPGLLAIGTKSYRTPSTQGELIQEIRMCKHRRT